MNLLEKAILIATEAHRGQVDKAGNPYLVHVLSVMEKGKTTEEKIVGVLHDLVEDTDWTFERLKAEGFGDEIVEAIRCLTKQEGEEYQHFIDRLKPNPLALRVKLNDLQDNMDVRRYQQITEKDVPRINKYLRAFHELTAFAASL